MDIPEALKPLSWLIGNWRSVKAEGSYPTIQPFTYEEELSFKTAGSQPLLQYESKTWHPVKKTPMHLESGFLRINKGTPGTNNYLAFMVSHNFGLTSLEEGYIGYGGYFINFKSTQISRMFYGKNPGVLYIEREYKLLDDGHLDFTLWMETSSTPHFQHLKALYEKVG